MGEELKKRTKKFALDVIELVAVVPQVAGVVLANGATASCFGCKEGLF